MSAVPSQRCGRRPLRWLSAYTLAAAALLILAALWDVGRCWATTAVELRRSKKGRNLRRIARAAETETRARKVIDPKDYKAAPMSAIKTNVKNEKLVNLLETQEYADIIDMMVLLNKEGLLDKFVRRALDYFDTVDIFQVVKEEKAGEGKNLAKRFRRDWSRIWPNQLDNLRIESFEKMYAFWSRLGSTKLVDVVLGDVLPDPRTGRGQAELEDMRPEEREEEIRRRVLESELVDQFEYMQEDNMDVQMLKPKLAPLFLEIAVKLERKVADPIETLPEWTSISFFTVIFGSLTIFSLFFWQVQIPFLSDAPPPPSASERTINNSKSAWAELEEAKQEFKDAQGVLTQPDVGGRPFSYIDMSFANPPTQ